MDDTARVLVNVALALRNGTALIRFRKTFREELESCFEIKHGQPPLAALRYKRSVLNMFVQHGAGVVAKRLLLALCPNGERRAPKVEVYVGGRTGYPECPKACLNIALSGITIALTSSQPQVYNRAKWTGADRTTD